MLADVGIEKVLELCIEARPQHGCERHGNRIRSRCMFPGHSDANPSMDIVFTDDRTFAKCFSCGQYESDGFKIAAHITGIYATSRLYAEIFGQRFGVKLSPELDDALVQEDLFSHFKQAVLTAGEHLLIHAASQNSKEFTYAKDAVNYLKKRGFPASGFMSLGIGIFPTLEHFSAHADNEAALTIGEYFGARVFEQKPKAVGRFGGWLMFPYYTTPTSIGRIKLRDPKDKTNEVWLGIHKEETRGFFGLNQYTGLVGEDLDAAHDAYVVEGEFDQLAMFQAQLDLNPNKQHIVLAASGSGASDLDILADSRISRVTIVGDNDAGGVQFTKRILEAAGQARVTDYSVYDWGTLAAHNDPDDVVQAGAYEDLMHGLTARTDIKELHEWARDTALAEIATLNNPSSIQQIEALNQGCTFIKNDLERGLYVSKVSEATGLDTGVLAKHMVSIETERGFLINLERQLAEVAAPVAMDGPDIALVYCRRTREIFPVHLKKPRDIELAFQMQVFGMTTYDYVAGTIGIPDKVRLTQGKVQVERPLNHQAKDLSGHFDWSVQNFVSGSHPLEKFRIRKQGLHWDNAEDDALRAAALPPGTPVHRLYCVNAHDRFVGAPRKNGLMAYEELTEPIHGLNLLYGQDRGWSKILTSVSVANEKPPLSREDTFEQTLMCMDGWCYERHELVRYFLAAYAMCISHIDVFEHLPFVLFTAPSQSGKSTFLKGLLRGEDPGDIGLIEHSTGFDDYTSAAVMQHAAGSTLLQGLDEWENPDDHNRYDQKSRAVATLLASVRNANGREGMRRSRGGRYGTPQDTYLRFAMAAAGIHPLKEEADRNRWFTLELLKQPGRQPPEIYMRQKLGQEGILRLRKSILLHSMQNAYLDHVAERQILQDIFVDGAIQTKTTRGAKALAPILTTLQAVGVDHVDWGQKFLDWRTDLLTASNTSAEQTMFQAVFETNAVLIPNEYARRSIISILANPDLRQYLSAADVGVYFMPGTNYITLYPKKLPEIIKHNANYRNATNVNQIHSLLRRNESVLYNPDFFRSRPKLLQHLRQYISNLRPEDLLAVSFDSLDFDQTPVGDPPKPDDVL
jgi:DNA primase